MTSRSASEVRLCIRLISKRPEEFNIKVDVGPYKSEDEREEGPPLSTTGLFPSAADLLEVSPTFRFWSKKAPREDEAFPETVLFCFEDDFPKDAEAWLSSLAMSILILFTSLSISTDFNRSTGYKK